MQPPADGGFISTVSFDQRTIYVRIFPGMILLCRLKLLPCLAAATPLQRQRWQIVGHGTGVTWPDLQLSISLPLLMRVLLQWRL